MCMDAKTSSDLECRGTRGDRAQAVSSQRTEMTQTKENTKSEKKELQRTRDNITRMR